MQGLKRAILYGFKPYELGRCGEGERKIDVLLKFFAGDESHESEARKILSQFFAHNYLELIAKSNGISDAFDDDVVEAYWIGNELLDQVSTDDLRQMLVKLYSKQNKASVEVMQKLVKKIPAGIKPHHSFHVLFGADQADPAIESCLVNWGRVELAQKELVLASPKLVRKNGRLTFSPSELVTKEISWNKIFLPDVQPNQIISYHWGLACEILDEKQQKNLREFTEQNFIALKRGK